MSPILDPKSTTSLPFESLFRALRREGVDAGNLLIPRTTTAFLARPRLPITLPFRLGPAVGHAVKNHQEAGLYATSGVSTTPHFERARSVYAAKEHVVVRIEVAGLERFGIQFFRVAA
jgi:hypothetical protein